MNYSEKEMMAEVAERVALQDPDNEDLATLALFLRQAVKSCTAEAQTDVCQACGETATRVSFYGDDRTAFGGGLGRYYHDYCASPCNLPSDMHASFVRTEDVTSCEEKGEEGK